MNNLDDKDKFLETQNLPKLNHEEMENLNRPITSKDIELVIKNLPTERSPGPDGITGKFYQTFEDLNLKDSTYKKAVRTNKCIQQSGRIQSPHTKISCISIHEQATI